MLLGFACRRPGCSRGRLGGTVVAALLVLLVGLMGERADAQQRQPDNAPSRRQRDRANRPEPPPDRPPRDFDRGPGPFPLGLPLPPSPEDEGPLRPGEVEELLEFARQKMPDMHQIMKRMRDRNPVEFDARFAPRAPRLRFLKRIFDRHPRLGELIAEHARNQKEIIEARNRVRRRGNAPLDRPAVQYIRGRVANSVRAEGEIFREMAQMIADNREAEIDRWVERMLAPDFDALAQPPRFRELLDEIHAADDEARPALEAALRDRVTERIDEVIGGLRRRAERLSADERQEVDHRVKRILEGGPVGPHAGPEGHRDGRPDDGP